VRHEVGEMASGVKEVEKRANVFDIVSHIEKIITLNWDRSRSIPTRHCFAGCLAWPRHDAIVKFVSHGKAIVALSSGQGCLIKVPAVSITRDVIMPLNVS
jgi:hypothetical protein